MASAGDGVGTPGPPNALTVVAPVATTVRPFGLPWWLDCSLAALVGAAHTVAYVHTAWWCLALGAIALLSGRLAQVPTRRAGLIGWAYGTAWLVAGTWWLYISLHRYGGLPAWMTVAAVVGLSAFLSLYLAAASALFARLRRGRPAPDALLFAALWLLAELARGVIFTGFPWVASGYAQVDSPLAVLAPFVGVYALGAVGAALAAWPALALVRSLARAQTQRTDAPDAPGAPLALRNDRSVGFALASVALALAALSWLGPPSFTTPTGTLSVTLIQGNVPQEEKFAAEHQGDALRWHVEQLLAARTDLVVASETAIPLLPEELPPEFWPALRKRFDTGHTAALFGAPQGDVDAGYTNSAIGLAPATPTYRYNKHHLVPFGEFVPTGFHWFTALMHIPLGDFDRGPLVAPSFHVHGERVAPNICYEDLFGEDLAARTLLPEGAPTIDANISNIGWFGPTIAVTQHLNISRMRTLELQRPMLRATNTGATAVVDHRGRVTDAVPPDSRGVLVARVQGRQGDTPFARWAGRWGLWPLLWVALAVVTIGRLPEKSMRRR